MEAVTVPAPRGGEAPSLVPLRPLPMFVGDDSTPTVRPAAQETDMPSPDVSTARVLMVQCAEARIAQKEAERCADLARGRREAAFVRLMELTRAGALRTAIALAEVTEKAAQAELDVWTAAAWRFDDEARDAARYALVALREGDVRGARAPCGTVQARTSFTPAVK